MAVTEHTVAVAQVHSILQGVRARGMDVAPLLARAGISQALLNAPLARVSQQQFALLIRAMRRSTRDELWGLCSTPLRVGSFGQCAKALVGCGQLHDALRLGFTTYHGLQADFVPRLSVHGDTAQVQLVRRSPANPRLDYAQKAFLLYTFGMACWLVARRVPLLGVDYTEAHPRSDISRVYQAPIHYDAPHIGLSFEARWLALPVVQNPQSLREFLRRAPGNLLIKYRDPSSVSERLRRVLRRHLSDELPSLEAVSPQLAMTPQTLRRRLQDEGHGYQALKDALRRDAAIELLAQRDLTLVDIANRVGFSEASTFARAFKKWCGVAPGEYRQTRLTGDDPAGS
jgi:AraC-like DNA-binding protein